MIVLDSGLASRQRPHFHWSAGPGHRSSHEGSDQSFSFQPPTPVCSAPVATGTSVTVSFTVNRSRRGHRPRHPQERDPCGGLRRTDAPLQPSRRPGLQDHLHRRFLLYRAVSVSVIYPWRGAFSLPPLSFAHHRGFRKTFFQKSSALRALRLCAKYNRRFQDQAPFGAQNVSTLDTPDFPWNPLPSPKKTALLAKNRGTHKTYRIRLHWKYLPKPHG